MAHALRSNAYRHRQTAFNGSGGWWWTPGLGLLAAVAIIVAGRSALDDSSVQDQASSPGIAIVPAAAPLVNEVSAPPASNSIPAPVIVTAPEPPLASAPDVIPVAAPPVAAGIRSEGGIRDIDFAALPSAQALARQLFGRVDGAQVRYADVTGDGQEEALVAITSDGTFGNLAVMVFTERAGTAQEILTRLAGHDRRGIALSVEGGQLTETAGVYGPSDANCCPSQLAKTYFRWDGAGLVVVRTETTTNAPGKQAD